MLKIFVAIFVSIFLYCIVSLIASFCNSHNRMVVGVTGALFSMIAIAALHLFCRPYGPSRMYRIAFIVCAISLILSCVNFTRGILHCEERY